ncbi:N-acetylmuramoyl-L-alanine amidase [Pararhodobacter zhoushanensis]|uniref:N-acetylmuramoyl-L-alanine amidase n=1 Tax=Pararhodobacter zhoushanensis TaxID=2479545 RepID=UPI000F8F4700|nr:N-acetylmuramoyl-L-alanine amidase [Pararhodobacter zhoushanensis]
MIYQGRARHPVREVIVHCSATRPSWFHNRPLADKVAEIRRWHVQDRGWRDIGYHWIIDRDGAVMAGRSETEIGAHVAGHNAGTIGVSLIGGHGSGARDAFADNFTPAQDAALRRLIEAIKGRVGGSMALSGHNQYASKACPGFNVATWYAGGAA